MSEPQRFSVQARSTARPEVVFALLADATSWRRWGRPLVLASSWQRGLPQGGVGAVRVLGKGPLSARERVLEQEAPRRHAYELVSWQPVRDYLGEVQLDQEGSGTRITWTVGFRARVPGAGRAQRLVLQRWVGGLASRLAAHASQL